MEKMKKGVLLGLSLALAISTAACGGGAATSSGKAAVTPSGEATTAQASPSANPSSSGKAVVSGEASPSPSGSSTNEVSIEETVILDQDSVKITAKSLQYEASSYNEGTVYVNLLVENGTDKVIKVSANNLSVNGLMVDSSLYTQVSAGKSANDTLVLDGDSLSFSNIDTIADIEFSINVMDTSSYDTIFDSDTITIKTSAESSYTQTYDDSGFTAVDENGIKIVAQGLLSNDDSYSNSTSILFYIENNSTQDVSIRADDVSVNGFMVSASLYPDVPAGKKAYVTLRLSDSDLESSNINDITTLEVSFTIREMDGYDKLYESGVVTINFE